MEVEPTHLAPFRNAFLYSGPTAIDPLPGLSSESPENIVQVVGTIGNGFEYLPWAGA